MQFPGNTLRHLIKALGQKYGPGVNKALLDQKGEIDMDLRVAVYASKFLSYGERMDIPLNEGDLLYFMTVG